MIWADYVLHTPQTLDDRRKDSSDQFRKEKNREYARKKRAKKCTSTKQPLKTS